MNVELSADSSTHVATILTILDLETSDLESLRSSLIVSVNFCSGQPMENICWRVVAEYQWRKRIPEPNQLLYLDALGVVGCNAGLPRPKCNKETPPREK